MSLFLCGVFFGMLVTSLLVWQFIIRPSRKLAENIETYEKTSVFPVDPVQVHPEIGRLRRKFTSIITKLEKHRRSNESLENAKQEFLSLVSHELRTPLTSIKGSLGLIVDGVLGPLNNRSLNFLKIAQSEVDRLIFLVNDILDIAKLEAGEIKYEKVWFDPHSLLRVVQSALMGLQQKNDVAVIVEPHATPCEIYGDPKRIQQLVTNLVSNAITHSPKKSMVIIGTDIRENGMFRFYVQDQGPGISLENQKQIFKKFVQAGPVNSQRDVGTGLGLAICKAIAKKHGGRVGVQSDIGKGSLFFFEIAEFRYKERSSDRKKGTQYEAA